MDKTNLLNELLNEASALEYASRGKLDAVKNRTEMIVSKIFGSDSTYIQKLNRLEFSPSVRFTGMSKDLYISSFNSGMKRFKNLLNVMIEDLQLTQSKENTISHITKNLTNNIFIVHGYNEEMKQSTARFLEKLSFSPIILHEQANKGRTIIEKFRDHSDVSCAIVLLSADDLAIKKDNEFKNAKLRARQNVIFELGFFLGKLGKEYVIVLHEDVPNFEILSDYQGVLFIKYGRFKFLLQQLNY